MQAAATAAPPARVETAPATDASPNAPSQDVSSSVHDASVSVNAAIPHPVAPVNGSRPPAGSVNNSRPPAGSANASRPPSASANVSRPHVAPVNESDSRAPTVNDNVAAAPAAALPAAPLPAAPLPVAPPVFAVGDNCLAMFAPGKWYLAHISTVNRNGTYTVYYPGDSSTQTVNAARVRAPTNNFAPRRGQMINRVFFWEGADDLPSGHWRVRRLGPASKNEFVCVRLSGEGKNMENFDIGYVIGQVLSYEQTLREKGPAFSPKF